MTKNYFTNRYNSVYDFELKDRTFSFDSDEEKTRKDLLRKAKYITVKDGEIKPGGESYGIEGHSFAEIVFVLRNAEGKLPEFLNGVDICKEYREEYIRIYGGTEEDLEY